MNKKGSLIRKVELGFIFAIIFISLYNIRIYASSFHEKESGVWTDGKVTYYGMENIIYKKEKGKTTRVLKFGNSYFDEDEIYYGADIHVVYVYGGYLFFNEVSDMGNPKLYSYNLNDKKIFKCCDHCRVINAKYNYIIATPIMSGDGSGDQIILYKINKKTIIKKIKLSSYGDLWSLYYDGKFYFTSYNNSYLVGSASLMSYDIKRNRINVAFTIKGNNQNEIRFERNIKDNRVEIIKYGAYDKRVKDYKKLYYRYNLKNNKLYRIKSQ